MNPEQMQQMVKWLNQQIINSNDLMNEAHQANNYCVETELEGLKEAYVKCLTKLSKM